MMVVLVLLLELFELSRAQKTDADRVAGSSFARSVPLVRRSQYVLLLLLPPRRWPPAFHCDAALRQHRRRFAFKHRATTHRRRTS